MLRYLIFKFIRNLLILNVKMYFWAVLLLLFVCKYTYCVPPREEIQEEPQEDPQEGPQEDPQEDPQDRMIPFPFEYSDRIEEILKEETSNFYVTLMGQITMGVCSLISSAFPAPAVPDSKMHFKISYIDFNYN